MAPLAAVNSAVSFLTFSTFSALGIAPPGAIHAFPEKKNAPADGGGAGSSEPDGPAVALTLPRQVPPEGGLRPRPCCLRPTEGTGRGGRRQRPSTGRKGRHAGGCPSSLRMASRYRMTW